MMTSAWEALSTATFRVNVIASMIINFAVNFGFEWATLSQWGKIEVKDFPRLYMTKWNYTVNSCILMDMLLTAFFIGSLTTLFATNGVVQDIKKGKMTPIATSVTDTFLWKLTPVRVMHLGIRSMLMGIWWTVVAGLPTIAIVAAALSGTSMDGVSYAWLKGVWAVAVCVPVNIFMFLSCADERLHRGLAFARLVEGSAAADAPPMVGRVARV